jgi:hypothetical protein
MANVMLTEYGVVARLRAENELIPLARGAPRKFAGV